MAQPAVELRLVGQLGKPARQQQRDRPEELTIRAEPGRRLGDGKRDQFLVADLPSGSGGESAAERVGCNKGLHDAVISGCSNHEVAGLGGPLRCPSSPPAGSTHLRPLVDVAGERRAVQRFVGAYNRHDVEAMLEKSLSPRSSGTPTFWPRSEGGEGASGDVRASATVSETSSGGPPAKPTSSTRRSATSWALE